MRSKFVFVILLLMSGGLIYLLAIRPRTPHLAPFVHARQGGADAGARYDARVLAHAADAGAATSAVVPDAPAVRDGSTAARRVDTGPRPLMDRGMRVTALGWELVAPGIVANRGGDPAPQSLFTAVGLEVHLSASETISQLEEQLARGGADPHGADIAILPLPMFVASYERLRALSPEMFMIVGWSRGREALLGDRELMMATWTPGNEVRLVGNPLDMATFFGLMVLDLAGAPPSRVRLIAPSTPAAATAPFAVLDRSRIEAPDAARRFVLTSADASRLVPMVAIAPRGFAQSHAEALQAWARVWVRGMEAQRIDVPNAARLVSSVAGAPEAIIVLSRLGTIEPATVRENARAAGLTGRSGATLEKLFTKTWGIWRASGVLSSPPPDAVPLSTTTIEMLVRADTSRPPSAPTAAAPISGDAAVQAFPLFTEGAGVLLVRRYNTARFDENEMISMLGFMAGIFERNQLRLSVRNDQDRARAILAAATQRFDIAPGRLFVGRGVSGNPQAAIELITGH